MTKINKEEYETLKELDDKWKWIARDEDTSLWVFTDKPFKKSGRVSSSCWDSEIGRSYPVLELIDEIHLFQFIQWEDEEPYNIQGLINEYLDDEYGYFNMKLSREFEEFIKKESEEAEVPKINKEEYEILKELDEKGFSWITNTGSSKEPNCINAYAYEPTKVINSNKKASTTYSLQPDEDTVTIIKTENGNLFQFIQWEDEEPYNIAELIEEYEIEQYIKESVELGEQAMRDHARKQLQDESEETEVKKDLDWVIQEIHTTRKVLADSESSGNETADEFTFNNGKEAGLVDVLKLLDQLDEPEVLTQEWIDEHKYPDTEYPDEHYVWEISLQNLLVPKQELPVVPAWFDEWWKYATKGGGNLFHNIERFYDELFSSGTRETYEYISNPDNKKKLLNIIINELEYEVEEEEQKYIVSDNSSIPLLIKDDSGKVMSYDSQIAYNNSNGTIELTEQEIKGYDPRYMAFAKPVEELEE